MNRKRYPGFVLENKRQDGRIPSGARPLRGRDLTVKPAHHFAGKKKAPMCGAILEQKRNLNGPAKYDRNGSRAQSCALVN